MRTLIVAGLVCLSAPTLALGQEAVTRTSPITTFTTTRTPAKFTACLLPVVQKDYPLSTATTTKNGGQMLFVTGGTPSVNLAVIDVSGGEGVRAMVVLRTEKPHGTPGLAIIKAARNCS